MNPIFPWWVVLLQLMLTIGIAILAVRGKSLDWARRAAIAFFFTLVLIDPASNEQDDARVPVVPADVIFLVDTTGSMLAEDYDLGSTRLARARHDLELMTSQMSGARFSLVSFDTSAKVLLPFTTDVNAAGYVIDSLYPVNNLYARGSDIGIARNTLKDLLKRSEKQRPDHKRFVIYLGDGEQTAEGKKPTKLEGKDIEGGAVIGYGTRKGGKMKAAQTLWLGEYAGKPSYVKYYDEKTFEETDAISRIDEDNLNKTAKGLDVEYMHRTKGSSPEDLEVVENVRDLQKKADNQGGGQTQVDRGLYWIFAAIMSLLLIWEMTHLLRETRETKALGKDWGKT